MTVNYEYVFRTEYKELGKGEGSCELKNPVMVYAQIPIELEQFHKISKACQEQKISVYDLLVRALEQDPEDIAYIW